MRHPRSITGPVVLAIAGAAGSGKTTLGRAIAASLNLPLIDLDAVTTPLLDALSPDLFYGHWLSSAHSATIREGRYAALTAVAADAMQTAGGVVIVAPFSAELVGDGAWKRLRAALDPAEIRMVHLDGDDTLLEARRSARGERRDDHRPHAPPVTPTIPVIRIDAELSTAQQLTRVYAEIGIRRAC